MNAGRRRSQKPPSTTKSACNTSQSNNCAPVGSESPSGGLRSALSCAPKVATAIISLERDQVLMIEDGLHIFMFLNVEPRLSNHLTFSSVRRKRSLVFACSGGLSSCSSCSRIFAKNSQGALNNPLSRSGRCPGLVVEVPEHIAGPSMGSMSPSPVIAG